MTKTIQPPRLAPQPDYDELPSWEALGQRAIEENQRNPYTGSPVWQFIREMRDER